MLHKSYTLIGRVLTGTPLIRKILVAIDGSKTAEMALDFGLDLAVKYSAEVMMVSVFDVISLSLVARGMVFTPRSTTKYLEELEGFYEKILGEAIDRAKRLNIKTKVSRKLLRGRAADKIIEIANEGEFDLIVMGSRGLGGIKEIFLGSVSDRVADEAKCSVLIVKEKVQ